MQPPDSFNEKMIYEIMFFVIILSKIQIEKALQWEQRKMNFEQQQIFSQQIINFDSPAANQTPVILAPSANHNESRNNQNDLNNIQMSANTHQMDMHILDQSGEMRFYHEYKRIYLVSYHLSLEKKKQVEIFDDLTKRLKIAQVKNFLYKDKMRDLRESEKTKKQYKQQDSKIKRSRRTAEEIEKKYKCQVVYCERFYGSEGSLQQHIKLKHPEIYKRDFSHSSSEINSKF